MPQSRSADNVVDSASRRTRWLCQIIVRRTMEPAPDAKQPTGHREASSDHMEPCLKALVSLPSHLEQNQESSSWPKRAPCSVPCLSLWCHFPYFLPLPPCGHRASFLSFKHTRVIPTPGTLYLRPLARNTFLQIFLGLSPHISGPNSKVTSPKSPSLSNVQNTPPRPNSVSPSYHDPVWSSSQCVSALHISSSFLYSYYVSLHEM